MPNTAASSAPDQCSSWLVGRDIHSGRALLAGRCRAAYGDDMASDHQTELRLARLENDSNSLYDLVAEICTTQQEHTRRFGAIDRRFDAIDGRFDAIDRRFDAVDRRFDSVVATLAEVVRRLPEPS